MAESLLKEGVSDVEDLNRVLDRAVKLKAFLKSDKRVTAVAKFVADHFKKNIHALRFVPMPRIPVGFW